jgi:hypothetical protein
MHAGATDHTSSATKPRQLDICVSLGRTPTVIQPLAKWRFFFSLSALGGPVSCRPSPSISSYQGQGMAGQQLSQFNLE